jgi:SAM-dependent methyltransferase
VLYLRRLIKNIACLLPPIVRVINEGDAARSERDLIRRECDKLIGLRSALLDERDKTLQERDHVIGRMHQALGDDPSSETVGSFSGHAVASGWWPLDYPKIVVETEASDEELRKICDHLAATWTKMGKQEPYFTVAAHEKFKMANIPNNKGEFFRSGFETLGEIEAITNRYDVDIRKYKDCFELGCGVGRMTGALASAFDKVFGMDISASHLAVAAEELSKAGRTNVEFRKFDNLASIDALPDFDFFTSFYVIQHNPPPIAAVLLEKILAKLRVGGAACFQCQTYQRHYRFTVGEYLEMIDGRRNKGDSWEMHVLPQPTIFDVLRRTGVSLLEVREDGCLGTGISQTFLARRDSLKWTPFCD